MENKRKNQIMLSELREAGFSESQAGEFLENLAHTDNLLSEHEVVVPDGLSVRVLESALASHAQKQKKYYSHYMRKIGSLAAMLLLVISLAVYYSGSHSKVAVPNSGGQVTTAVNSSNPFAHPSLIMDVLLERSSANRVDDFTLDAASEFWEYPVTESNGSTSIKRGDNNEILA